MTKPHSTIWILGEQADGTIQRVTFELMTRGLALAQKRGTGLSVMLFGHQVREDALRDLIDRGADRVVSVQHPGLTHFLVEPYAACMVDLIEKYRPEIILAGATALGRTLMPYVAVKVNAGLTADCTLLDIDEQTGTLLQTRPAIGGNIMATITTPDHRPQMATVRPRSTAPAEKQSGRTGEIVKITPDRIADSRLVYHGFAPYGTGITIAAADVVVAVGRGIKKKENLSIIYDLAEALNAAVAATRDVVDKGWLTYAQQIGLSGHTVSPRLYIGIGLSGSIQHLAGMQTAEHVVAINKDPEAQIFKVANYGIVGDLFEIVPLMTEAIKKGQA
jgi:electron transfer flavoprotein alpha subunit